MYKRVSLRPLHLIATTGLILLNTACQNTRVDEKAFVPSSEHLQVNSRHASQQAPIPTISHNAPYLPKPKTSKSNDLYSISVVQTPVKDVLFKLARDAGLDIDVMVSSNDLITLNALDQTLPSIIERLNEQTGLKIVLDSNRLIVQEDKPYWVNYPIDYVNLDRYTQSSILLANAVGSRSTGQGGGAVSLGAPSTQPQQAASIQSGSNVAILNRSKHEVWTTLDTGIKSILRAIYPSLSAPLAAGATEPPSTKQATNTPVASTNESSAGLPAISSLPAPEQSLTAAPAVPFSPYPEGSSVSRYVNLVREAGFVSVYAPEKGQKEVQKYIDQLMSGGRRQVMIEATVVEVELNDEHQSGVNWSALASDGTFGIAQAFNGTSSTSATAGLVSVTGSSISKDWSLGSTLKLLERFGNSRVLSSPKMVGINNQPTLLKVVKNLVYFSVQAQVIAGTTGQSSTRAYTTTPNTVPIGLVMSILPSISETNEITLVVRPTISTLSSYVNDPNPDLVDPSGKRIDNLVPVIQEREMESVLKLNDGQIAVLGGLIQDTVDTEDTGIPGAVGEPVLGYLFGQKNKAKHKSELVIFLKPVLITHPDIENGSFSDKKHLLPKLSEPAMGGYLQ